jgi:hypothetical protein
MFYRSFFNLANTKDVQTTDEPPAVCSPRCGFASEAPEDGETDRQRHNRLQRMRYRGHRAAAPAQESAAPDGELQALHGPHYDAPQDGETEHARRRRMSRMRMRGRRARAHVSSRAGAHSAERDGASIALPRVASLPLRADVQLAARQQRIADELREECRKSFRAVRRHRALRAAGQVGRAEPVAQASERSSERSELRTRNS